MTLFEDTAEAFLVNAPDAMVVVNSSGHVAFANFEIEHMFMIPRADLVGGALSALLPARFGVRCSRLIDEALRPSQLKTTCSDGWASY